MANGFYTKGLEQMLNANIAWASDTIKAVLVDSATYTPNLSTDDFLSDIPSGERVATVTLANGVVTGGNVDFDDAVFSSVSGDESELVVIYKDTGDAATSPLLILFDTATGLSYVPNGNDIDLVLNGSGLFTLQNA